MQTSQAHYLKIVLVDDDEEDALMFSEIINDINLSQAQVHVELEALQNGVLLADLLAQYRGILPNLLVMLDVKMPGEDGFAVLSRLKGNAATKRIPVVMYSSSDSEHDKSRAYQRCANGYVVKASEFQQMYRRLRHVVNYFAIANSV